MRLATDFILYVSTISILCAQGQPGKAENQRCAGDRQAKQRQDKGIL